MEDRSFKLVVAETTAAFMDRGWVERSPPALTVVDAAQLLAVPDATVYSRSSAELHQVSEQQFRCRNARAKRVLMTLARQRTQFARWHGPLIRGTLS